MELETIHCLNCFLKVLIRLSPLKYNFILLDFTENIIGFYRIIEYVSIVFILGSQ